MSDGVDEVVQLGPPRRGRSCAACSALIFALAGVALAGCALSEGGVGSLIVDPGRYAVYHCKDLAERLKALRDREKELRGLMEKASEGGGGTVIGTLAYRTDYESVLTEQTLIRRTAAEKKCELAPTFQSDQTIR